MSDKHRTGLLGQPTAERYAFELNQTVTTFRSTHIIQQTSLPLRPQHPQPKSYLRRCLACGKVGCRLRSHIAYSLQLPDSQSIILPGLEQRHVSTVSPAKTQVGNPRIDPFVQYPMRMTYEEQLLLDLWAQPWGSDNTKGPERAHFPHPYTFMERIRPFVLQNALLLRAVLSMIATQRSLATGKIDEAAFNQQLQVSKMHMEAMQNPKEAKSDANIVTGMAIMSNYMAQGNVAEGMRLLDGLNQMVHDRGGLQYLGMNGLTSRYLLLSDHWQSVIRLRKPVFPLTLPSLQFPIEQPLVQGSGFKHLSKVGGLDPSLALAAVDLVRATQLFVQGCYENMSTQQLGAFEYLSGIAEYQLGTLHTEYYQASLKSSCICTALLIFNHTVLRWAGGIPPAIRLMEARFWMDFSAADDKGLWNSVDQFFLIWIILTPLIIGVRAPCQRTGYAIRKLQDIQQKVGIKGFEDLKSRVLQSFIWYPIAQESFLRELWEKVQTRK